MTTREVTSNHSHCKICTSQCGIVVDVNAGQVVKVKGDRDHPLSKGYTCPKGRALGKLHLHPNAILKPLFRKSGALD
ncbi:hypothetical protein [Pseudomaricurvus sp.]|uniref:hypothetical protein n=1 Tax=Pseudomaricurvus sp. TaxID=2004510 RepID=UPI003F6CD62A